MSLCAGPRVDARTATPLIAKLMDSVAPDVHTISSGAALMSAATRSRASSTAWAAACPGRCVLDAGLANTPSGPHVPQHRFHHSRVHRRRRGIVQIYRLRHPHALVKRPLHLNRSRGPSPPQKAVGPIGNPSAYGTPPNRRHPHEIGTAPVTSRSRLELSVLGNERTIRSSAATRLVVTNLASDVLHICDRLYRH